MVRRTDVQRLHLLHKVLRPAVTQGAIVFRDSPGLAQDSIVDVGEVLYIADRVPLMFEKSDQRIRHGIGKRVAQMCRRIWGDAADIEGHGGVCGFERLDAAG